MFISYIQTAVASYYINTGNEKKDLSAEKIQNRFYVRNIIFSIHQHPYLKILFKSPKSILYGVYQQRIYYIIRID